jgi:hypothetical protein
MLLERIASAAERGGATLCRFITYMSDRRDAALGPTVEVPYR